jgi:hypothetical protein
MNRRSFLLALVATPAAAAVRSAFPPLHFLPAPVEIGPALLTGYFLAPTASINPLFTGEIGRYEGFRIIESRFTS